MKNARLLLIPAALIIFLISGCYTQMYRPDMEQGGQRQATLYNRYDSTAIDTTLQRDTTDYYETYPDPGWSYWGRPRLNPRQGPIWGWDFNNYMPDYYWGYYGYDSYYGTPWWNDWYDGYGSYYPGGSNGPAEPPSKRNGGRSRDDRGGGAYSAPPAAPNSSPAYATPPSNPQPATPPADSGAKKDDGKRSGGRGR